MFATLKDALNYIENRRANHSFEYFKSVLDHEHISYDLPCIHVTGTNGKGGTINFIASILEEAGYKVGTFTSPYILCHQDRFMINHEMMSDEDLLNYINQNVEIIEKYGLAMFEIDTLIMFQYFKDKKVDIAIIEVGIGGRNDKTNMVSPIASIITNIGHDHLKQMGPTLEDVAYEKAGIIKDDTPIFTSQLDDHLLSVIRQEANKKNAPLYIVDEIEKDLLLQLEGEYHLKNATMAKKVINTVFPMISDYQINQGLYKATWPGRFERLMVGNSMVYLDGAHNLEAIQALIKNVEKLNLKTMPIFLYAPLADKEYELMASEIKKAGYDLEVCLFQDGRALNKNQSLNLDANQLYSSIDEALEAISKQSQTYIICGSLHFISQIRSKIIQK